MQVQARNAHLLYRSLTMYQHISYVISLLCRIVLLCFWEGRVSAP